MITLIKQSPILVSSAISFLLFIALIFLGWILRNRIKINIGTFYNFFSVIVSGFVWLYLVYSYGLLGAWDIGLFLRWYFAVVIFLSVWYLAKIFSALFWDFYLIEYRKMQVPGLLRSLVTVLILIAAMLLIARFVFGQQLSGLLVASSVMAAVIAFALQDFLGGLIAGIALNIQPPFEAGDWIRVIGNEGEVVDINWRATTLRTLERTYLVVPNSIISKEEIVNFYEPTRLHALLLTVGVEYGSPPTLVKDTLISCALESNGVRSTPKPLCRLINYGDFSITYEIKFYIDDHSLHNDIRDEVMTRIWYSLKRKGIKIPFPIRDVFVHDALEKGAELETKQKKNEDFLRRASIFDPLEDTDIRSLVSSSRHWFFGKGERIVKQGESGSSLYLILEGSVGVYVKLPDGGGEINVGRLSSGDFFGEKSLLTGEPRSASVIAESDIEVVEIEKSDLEPILEKTPEIMEQLSERLAERQLINEGFFEEVRKEEEVQVARANYSERFLRGMKAFFGL